MHCNFLGVGLLGLLSKLSSKEKEETDTEFISR